MRGSLLKNFSFLTASGILMPFASMLLVVTISRLGGVEMLGHYTLLLTFFFIGQTCGTAGLQILITREVSRSRVRAGEYLLSASVLGALAVVLVSAVLVPTFVWSVPGAEIRLSVALMALALFPTTVIAFAESVLLAFEHAEDFVLVNFIETIVRTVAGTVVVLFGWGIAGVAATFLVCRVGAASAMIRCLLHRDPGMRLAIDGMCVAELARHVPVVGSIPVLNALYWRLDTLLLTWMRGIVDVGFYGASTRILDITRNLPQAYARALYPVLSKAAHVEREEFERLCRDSLVWIAVGTFPIAIATFGLAPIIVSALYGPEMTTAVPGLQIVAWLVVPYSLTSTLAQILFAAGLQALDLRVNVVAVATNAALNLLLIPSLGFLGAATAALATIIVHVSLQYRYVQSRVFDPAVSSQLGRIVLAGAVAGLVTWSNGHGHPVVMTTVGLACYVLALWIGGILDRTHWHAAGRHGRTMVRRFAAHLPRWSRIERNLTPRRPPLAK